jgi:hypothetical protein
MAIASTSCDDNGYSGGWRRSRPLFIQLCRSRQLHLLQQAQERDVGPLPLGVRTPVPRPSIQVGIASPNSSTVEFATRGQGGRKLAENIPRRRGFELPTLGLERAGAGKRLAGRFFRPGIVPLESLKDRSGRSTSSCSKWHSKMELTLQLVGNLLNC